MSLIASASEYLQFHEWPQGLLQHTYNPSICTEKSMETICWDKSGSWMLVTPSVGPIELLIVKDNIKKATAVTEIQQPTCAVFQNTTKRGIAVGSQTGHILVYDLKARKTEKFFPPASCAVFRVEYNSHDSHLVAATGSEVLLYNNTSTNYATSFKFVDKQVVTAMHFHRKSRNLFAAACDAGIAMVWDISRNASKNKITAHNAFVTDISFSPVSSDLLLTAGLDRKFCFHDIRSKQQVVDIQTEISVTALDFSHCGIYVGMGAQNGEISIYDTRALNKTVSSFAAHNGKIVKHLSFQKKQQVAADSSSNNYLEQYDPQSPSQEVCISKAEQSDPFDRISLYSSCSSGYRQDSPSGLSSDADDSFLAAMDLQPGSGKLGKTVNLGQKSLSSDYTKTWKEIVLKNSVQSVSSYTNSPHPNLTGGQLFKTPLPPIKLMASTPTFFGKDFTVPISPITDDDQSPPLASTTSHLEPSSLKTTNREEEPATQKALSAATTEIIEDSTIKNLVAQAVKEGFAGLKADIKVNLEEFKSDVAGKLDEFKTGLEGKLDELKWSIEESQRHTRLQFMHLYWHIIKEFVDVEDMLNHGHNTEE